MPKVSNAAIDETKILSFSRDFNPDRLFAELEAVEGLAPKQAGAFRVARYTLSFTADGFKLEVPADIDEEAVSAVIAAHDATPAPAKPTRKEQRQAAIDAIDETKPAAALRVIKALLKDLD